MFLLLRRWPSKVGPLKVEKGAYCEHFEHYGPLPNPYILFDFLFGLTIML